MADKFKKMTFADHFDELRSRLIVCVTAVVVTFIICFCFKDFLVNLVLMPYEALREAKANDPTAVPLNKLVFIGVTEKFVFYLKVCFLISVFISTPIILHQMWRFIAAGLYENERRPVMRVVPFSMLLFLGGMLFGYLVLFPIGLGFLIDFGNQELLTASISVNRYFSLFTLLIVVMGFIFQTPLIMVVTTSIGLTTPELFTSKRKIFIVVAFILAALFTPPDWVTQVLLACPLIVLFEIGVILSRGVKKRRDEREKVEEEEYDREMAAASRGTDEAKEDEDDDINYPAG